MCIKLEINQGCKHSVQYWRNDFDQGRAGFKFRNLPRFDQLVKALRYKLEGRGFDS